MKKRIQISINPDLVAVATEIMAIRKFDSFSGLLEALIREDWERKSNAYAASNSHILGPVNSGSKISKK